MSIGEEWIDPVTDRTQYDVDRARSYINSMKGRYDTLEGMKGCLNISDLNRIEGNIKYLSDILSLSLTTKEWAISEIPTSSDESRIIGNTSSLLSAISMENPPTIPDNLYSYSDFNEIEDILLTIYENIPPYDETKIAVVLLDENDEPTDNIVYFNTVADASAFLKNNSSNRYLVHIGNATGISTIATRAFDSCVSLVKVEIPDSVTSIESVAFIGCTSLISANIPDGVTDISAGIFYSCSSLASIDIPENVASIGQEAFWGCSSLNTIILPDEVSSIGVAAFRYCSSLISVNIPDGVENIRSSTFNSCTSLTGIEIPSSVTTISNTAFSNCPSMTSIVVNKQQNSISGSPWGAANALVIWTG